jgi:dTDP-glucose 4,6-dehydratase
MKILVTGGLGFIGSNFIRYMLNKNDDLKITNMDNLSEGSNQANLRDLESDKRYEFFKGDIANKELVYSLIKEADVVVNIAAETHVDRSIANPWAFIHSNILGAVTLFEAASINKKPMLHVSTDEIYGDIIKGSLKENAKLKPSSPYSASKAAADLFALAYNRTYDLDIVIVRCTNNYGLYQFPEKLIPKIIIRAYLGLPVPLYGDGSNIREWTYVLDFCEALNLLLKKRKSGGIYNVSSGNELKNIDLTKKILRIMGKPETLITFVEDRPGHDKRYSLDSSKIRKEIGWKPKHSFKASLEETVSWYVNNEWWWKAITTEKTLHPSPWKLKW